MARRLILVTGGVRSGKSRYAEKIAAEFSSVCYAATAWAGDEEMNERIQLHRSRRPESWLTVEEQIDLAGVLKRNRDKACVLVDCLGMWLTNLLCSQGAPEVQNALDSLLQALKQYPGTAILVSNEVGWGLVPDNKLGRQFRDWLGWINQEVAVLADEVVLMVAGCPIHVKQGGRDGNAC